MASSTASGTSDPPSFLQTWEGKLKQEYIDTMAEMEDTPNGTRAKYLNWNHYFGCIFNDKPDGQAKLAEYLDKMKNLMGDVVKISPGPAHNDAVPEKLPAAPVADDSGEAEPKKFRLNLWHLPFHATGDAHIPKRAFADRKFPCDMLVVRVVGRALQSPWVGLSKCSWPLGGFAWMPLAVFTGDPLGGRGARKISPSS